MRIFRNDLVLVQAISTCPVHLETFGNRVESVEAVRRSHPQYAFVIDKQAWHVIIGQALRIGWIMKIRFELPRPSIDAIESSIGAEPKRTGAVFCYRPYRGVEEAPVPRRAAV